MSTSKILPAESLTAFERWELPSHDPLPEPEPEPEEVVIEEVPRLTLEEIEQIQKEAYEEGFRLGKEEGHAAGHAAGHQEGLKLGEKEVRAEVQRLRQIIQAFTTPLAEVDEAVEEELVQLAIAVARQLIRRELKSDPNQIIGVVREAMAALPASSRKVRLHLHPADADIIRERLPMGEHEEEAWRIVDDPTLARGGCRIETEHSRVDATVEKRLNAVIAQVLGGERRDDHAEPPHTP